MSNSTPEKKSAKKTPKLSKDNPFRIPTDEEVFVLRDEEKKRRNQERKEQLAKPVHEKLTWSTRLKVHRIVDESKFKKDKTKKPPPIEKVYREKEKMADYIDKKRKMFLLQMSLDTKKAEIEKLEKKMREREEKLAEEEQALIRDSQKFDEFLSVNDMKAMEAVNLAEEEMKAKTLKQNEIKKLNVKISAIDNEIQKLDEQLANCTAYKEFLDSLSPPEWLAQQEEKRKQLAEKKKKKDAVVEEQKEQKPAENELELKPMYKPVLPSLIQTQSKAEEKTDEDECEEGCEMYFTDPKQLLAIFSDLEENNLFLINNCQQIEEQLEELKKIYRETKENMDKEAANLKAQIDVLEEQIAKEQEKAAAIAARAKQNTDSESKDKLESLRAKIKEIYVAAGFDYPASGHIDTLQLLTQIENKLESLLATMDEYEDDFIASLERAQEKARRKKQREERNNMFKQGKKSDQQKKPKKDVKPRTGRRLMFRSVPVDKVSKKEVKDDKKEERDEFMILFDIPKVATN